MRGVESFCLSLVQDLLLSFEGSPLTFLMRLSPSLCIRETSVELLAKFIQQHATHKMQMMPDGVLADAATANRIHAAINSIKHSMSPS